MASTKEQLSKAAESQESFNQQALVETGNLMTMTDVQDQLEQAKAVVVEDASVVCRLVATGVDTPLIKPEELVDHYLPVTKEELVLAKLATPIDGSDTATVKEQSYVCLGSLSSKLRNRAYAYSIAKIQRAKENGQEILSHLQNLVDLIEISKKEAESAIKLQDIQAKLNQIRLDWKKHQPSDQAQEELPEKSEQLETQSLAVTQNFSDQLQTICRTLASNVHGLPQNIEDQVQHMRKLAEEIYSTLSSATSFQDLSPQFLTQSKEQMLKIHEGLDGVMDYLLHNTPLNWLVEPFVPQVTEDPEHLGSSMKQSMVVPQKGEEEEIVS